MANFATLLQTIASNIYTNGRNEIDAADLKSVLNAMVEELGQAGYIFKGVAQTSTNPGTPDTNVFYLAGVGTFTNFGGTTVDKGHIGVFAYNGSWSYQVLTTGAWFDSEVYPGEVALEMTFYDSDESDGVTIKINADVSNLGNSKLEAISAWWAAQKERRINEIGGFTIEKDSVVDSSPTTLGLFQYIAQGQIIDSITGATSLIFISNETPGQEVTVNAADLPYTAAKTFVSVKSPSGTLTNVKIHVEGEVAGGKLADGVITTDKIADEAVTKGKLAQNVSADLDWAVASNSYYRSSQAGNVAAKVITTYRNIGLKGGGSLKVTFENANTADDATLNIDGTGAKPLYYNGVRVSSTNSWAAGETVEIYYNSYVSGIYYAKKWQTDVVSVSQNIETGKTELLIGDTPALIVDNEPEAGSDNLVKSGGVKTYEDINNALFDFEGGEMSGETIDGYFINYLGQYEYNAAFKCKKYDISNLRTGAIKWETSLVSNRWVASVALFKDSTLVYLGPTTDVANNGILDLSKYDANYCYVSTSISGDCSAFINRYDRIDKIEQNEKILIEDVNLFYGVEIFSRYGYFLKPNGTIEENIHYAVTDYITIENAERIDVVAMMNNEYGGGFSFYDINHNFISSIYNVDTEHPSDKSVPYTVEKSSIPSNAYCIVVCRRIDEGYGESSVTLYFDKSSYLNSLKDSEYIRYSISENEFINDNKFIEASGTIISNSAYKMTDFISLSNVAFCDIYAVMANIYGGGISFYDEHYNFISLIYNVTTPETDNNQHYQLLSSQFPSNAKFIKVQGRKGMKHEPSVEVFVDKQSLFNDINKAKAANSFLLSNSASQLITDGVVEINNTPQTKNGYLIGASMLVDTMGKIKISKGVNAWGAGIIDIDDTNLYVYNPANPESAPGVYPHGLIISDFIIVQIELPLNAANVTSQMYFATVRITTNASQSFEKANVSWLGCSGNVKLTALSGIYSDVIVTMNGEAFKKDIWIFGDSYTDMWCNYLTPLKAYNCMIDGKSGRQSVEALSSLRNALKIGIPKTIIWAMGMNDGDVNSVVNTNWLNAFNSVKTICETYGIELLPVTIPNTPVVTNYYKNQVVKSSGLKYIDVANIVGANEVNSTWYSGLLSGDNVHPSAKGNLVIANFILSEVPTLSVM